MPCLTKTAQSLQLWLQTHLVHVTPTILTQNSTYLYTHLSFINPPSITLPQKHLPPGNLYIYIYPLPDGTFESMIFLFPRCDMLVPRRVHKTYATVTPNKKNPNGSQDATDEILALGHSEGFGAVFSGGNEGIIRYLASELQQQI